MQARTLAPVGKIETFAKILTLTKKDFLNSAK